MVGNRGPGKTRSYLWLATQYNALARIAETNSPATTAHQKNTLRFRRKALPPWPGNR